MGLSAEFRLDYPPSVNSYWRTTRGGQTYLSKAGRQYREAAAAATDVRFGQRRVQVYIELTMPDRRRRDLDNTLKALLDAIEHAGIVDDDCQIDRLMVERIHVEPPGAADVVIEEIG